jgi:uncharacterized protein
MKQSKQRQLLSSICHLSIFFSSSLFGFSICIPIAILILSDDPVIKKNAKEVINYHINIFLWILIVLVGFIIGLTISSVIIEAMNSFLRIPSSPIEQILLVLGIGLMLLLFLFMIISLSIMILLLVMSIIFPFIATIAILNNPDKHYRYPLIFFHFVR